MKKNSQLKNKKKYDVQKTACCRKNFENLRNQSNQKLKFLKLPTWCQMLHYIQYRYLYIWPMSKIAQTILMKQKLLTIFKKKERKKRSIQVSVWNFVKNYFDKFFNINEINSLFGH